MSELTKVVLKVLDINGTEVAIEADVTKEITIEYANGDTRTVKLAKPSVRNTMDINEMDIEDLRKEIRNAHSVFYKSNKKFESMTDEEKLAFDPTSMNAQKARWEAAVALFNEKFPGQAMAVNAAAKDPSAPKAPKKNAKLEQLNSVIASIKESAIPEEAKVEALAKLDALVAALQPKPRKEKKADEEVAAETPAEAVENTEAAVNPVTPVATGRGRRG